MLKACIVGQLQWAVCDVVLAGKQNRDLEAGAAGASHGDPDGRGSRFSSAQIQKAEVEAGCWLSLADVSARLIR
jgi:hypothetical protein